MRIRTIKEVTNVMNNAKNKLKKMNEKYPEMYKNELEKIARSVMIRWYSSYHPYYYDRQMELWNHAWRITLNGTEYKVEFGYELMDSIYHQDVEIVFNNSFVNGYHGGSFHDRGNIPYWRTPYPEFTSKGRPAIRSFSPYSKMMSEMKKKIKELDIKKQNEFNSIINRVLRSVNRLR